MAAPTPPILATRGAQMFPTLTPAQTIAALHASLASPAEQSLARSVQSA